MAHQNRTLANILKRLDIGSSVAESDNLLETARIETSVFADLVNDRVDLIPGTKGSGKSALFRIFVDFLPDALLSQRKVVIAHGIQAPGDPVFHAYTDQFIKLSEDEFVSFWCIYLVSLAHEQFIKGQRYQEFLQKAGAEIEKFRTACANARIPEIQAKKSLRDILEWSLHVLISWRPKIRFIPPGESGQYELDLFGTNTPTPQAKKEEGSEHSLPKYVNEIKETLEEVLKKSQLSLWLMIDRLDEIFPRRSEVERLALRGLLRAMRYFASESIRIKIFLRDDMLEQVVRGENGFTALTHVTARKADTIRWSQDSILAMVVKRLFANKNDELTNYLDVNREQIEASPSYRSNCFYMLFPPTVFRGTNQSSTISWICNRCADGRGVVTPRDVLDLLIRAKQKQQDLCSADPEGQSDWVISATSIQYGLEELSKHKRQTYLQAEFPHLWRDMEKFDGGKTDYTERALRTLLGKEWNIITTQLRDIGFLSKGKKRGEEVFSIPILYRHGMNLTQGKA